MNTSKKRIEWLDVAKAIGIILVVVGHVTQNQLLYNIIYSFHMPLFFIISGYIYGIENKENFYNKNWNGLMRPFYIFGIISYLYWLFFERLVRTQTISPILPLINFVLLDGGNDYLVENVALWFLPCLFMVKSIVFFFSNKLTRKIKVILVLTLATVSWFVYKKCNFTLIFMLERLGVYILFFSIGFIAFKKQYKNLQNNYSIVLIIISLLLFIICNIINLKIDSIPVNFIMYFVIPLFASTFIFTISKFVKNRILKYIGKNTLIILCIHEPIKRIFIKVISVITSISDSALRQNLSISIIISLLLILILIPLIYIINKYLPFLIKKQNAKKIKN